MATSYALIADIIGSRRLPDRAAAQEVLTTTLAQAAAGLDLSQAPHPTVGDEFQAVAANLDGALTLTLRTHLLLPPGLLLRFGIGAGEVVPVPASSGTIQDGSAWWAAREAIERAHELQDAGRDFVRTWLRLAGAEQDREHEAALNAMLLLRDHAVARMRTRQRRVLAGLLMGSTQVDIARREKVSQAAVSDFSRGPGAALLEAQALLSALAEGAPARPRGAGDPR